MSFKHHLIKHLDGKKVKYKVVNHKKVYTAYDLAQTLREKLEHIAKTIVIEADKNRYLVVLPGSHRLNIPKLKKLLKAKNVQIAKEKVMQQYYKVKPGAITAFGKLHKNSPVLVDKALTKAKKVITATGDFEQSLHMSMKEFLKATEGSLGAFSDKAKLTLQAKPKKKKAAKKRRPAKRKKR